MSASATASAALTSSDVLAMLRRHYLPEGRPPAGLFAPEIGSPKGDRRADLVWMPTTVTTRDRLVGHEIKVTRSDVMAELADPTKADAWAKCCTRWWLVVADPALVDGLDVPEMWGVMAPPSGRRTRTMTVLRPAPHLAPHASDVAAGLRRLATWEMHRNRDREERLRRELQYAQGRLRSTEEQLREAQVASEGRYNPHAAAVSRILHAAEQQSTSVGLFATVREEDVIAAIVDVAATRAAATRTRWDIDHLCRTLQGLVDPLSGARKALEKAAAAGRAEMVSLEEASAR